MVGKKKVVKKKKGEKTKWLSNMYIQNNLLKAITLKDNILVLYFTNNQLKWKNCAKKVDNLTLGKFSNNILKVF